MKKINSKTRITIFFTGLLVFLILCCGSASAATINVNPGTNAIKNAINNANPGDTLYLHKGTYSERNLVINKDLTIAGPKVTTGNPTAIVDAQQLDRVFIINSGMKVNMKYLTIKNGATVLDDGGGILNNGGTLSIYGCNLNHNFADVRGGAICSYGTLKVYNSYINNNDGHFYGGGISCTGSLTVSNSKFENNVAGRGGGICTFANSKISHTNFYGNKGQLGAGIYNSKTSTVSNCEFKLNEATFGNAICNFVGSTILRYNRLLDSHNQIDNTKNYELHAEDGSIDAEYNWWGSNNSPSSKISLYKGTVDYSPWIKDITGVPKFSSSTPANGTKNVARNSAIKVIFNEYIKAGTNFIELKTSTGTIIKIAIYFNGKSLTLKPSSKLTANTKYIVCLHTGCVTDQLNNKLALKSFSFITGST